MKIALLWVLLTGCLPTRAAVSVSLVSERQGLSAAETARIGVKFELARGWYLYWQNPGDTGLAPQVEWQLPQGVQALATQWPTPQVIQKPPFTYFGFYETLLLVTPVVVASHTSGPVEIEAKVKWLACEKICVPGEKTLHLRLSVLPQAALSPEAPLFSKTLAQIPMALPQSVSPTFEFRKGAFQLEFTGAQPLGPEPVEFLPLSRHTVDLLSPRFASVDRGKLSYRLMPSAKLDHEPTQITGVLRTPTRSYHFVANARAASFWHHCLWALLGGVLLNLMPCVFPVLSIKALSLYELSTRSRRGAMAHGLAYTLGILVSFWALSGILLGLRALGHGLGWGFQLQSPVFASYLALLLFLLSLSLLGFFEVGAAWVGLGSGLASRSGHRGAFFTGALATVVATPCTAPFMGTAIGFALGESPQVALAVFTSLALGLALPYLLLSFQPQWLRFLPRPGRWMETLKQAMAFPFLATVVWLLWVVGRQAGTDGMIRGVAGLVTVAFAVWLARRWDRALVKGVGVALGLGALALVSLPPPSSSVAQWRPYSREQVAALRQSGKPVFIDFTAAWCVTCQVNERLTLSSKEIWAEFEKKGVVAVKADWTDSDPDITEALRELGHSSVPVYVLYYGNGAKQILPPLLTKEIVLAALDKIPQRNVVSYNR